MAVGAFVGRERPLAQMLERLDALAGAGGSLFLLAGEPGIGKTRLADQLGHRARARGATVAWGSAWDGGGAPAYWPWLEVLRALRPLIPDPDEHLRRDLGPLWELPSGPGEEPSAIDPELIRFRRFDALRAVLQLAAAKAPLVIVLDDLHAADRASLFALHFVARALRSLPVFILGTHREPQDADIAELLARIAREGSTVRLHPFGREEIAALMATLEPVTSDLIEDVYRATAGNPLLIQETMRLVRTGERPSRIREHAVAVLRHRIARLDAATRETLEVVAVLGREIDRSAMAEICSIETAELELRLRAAQSSGMIELSAAEARFTHGLFREELIASIAGDRKRTLHLRGGEVLVGRLSRGHPVAEESIAGHLIAALPEGDPANAAEWAIRAGETAARSLAFDRAAELFAGALAALERMPPDPARRIDVSLRLAESLARAGVHERCRTVCDSAAQAARASGDAVRLARAALIRGLQIRIGVIDQQLIDLLQESLQMLGEREPALRARVLARLAAAEQPSIDPHVPVRKAREAIALARTVGDPDTLLATLYAAGSALVDYAPAGERRSVAEEVVRLALPRGELALAQQGYVRAAIDSMELCDLAAADAAIAGHERLGRALGHPRWQWRSALLRSMRALMEGRWDDSLRAREEAAALAAQADDPNARLTLATHALGALRAKDGGTAADMAAVWDVALDAFPFSTVLRALFQASILGRTGDLEPARRALALFPPADDLGFLAEPVGLSLYSEAVAMTGERAFAELLARHLLGIREYALSWGVMGLTWEGPAEHWIGCLALVAERWDEAIRSLEIAVARSERLGARPHALRSRERLCRALIGRGDRDRAAAMLDPAIEGAKELEMVHLAEQMAALRGQLGAPARAATPPSVEPGDLCLSREGDVWSITRGETVVRLRHSRALEILHQLVESRGREIHVLDLGSPRDPTEVIDGGDAGEILDAEAKAAYRRRIAELGDELREAEAWADVARRDRVRAELEFLQDELSRSVGLGGRSRRTGAAAERARVNVTKRLKGIIKKIGELEPDLGRHLESTVRTGIYVSYLAGSRT